MSLWTSRKLSNLCVAAAVLLCLLGAQAKTAALFAAAIVLLLPFRQWAVPLYCPCCGRELNAQNPDR